MDLADLVNAFAQQFVVDFVAGVVHHQTSVAVVGLTRLEIMYHSLITMEKCSPSAAVVWAMPAKEWLWWNCCFCLRGKKMRGWFCCLGEVPSSGWLIWPTFAGEVPAGEEDDEVVG